LEALPKTTPILHVKHVKNIVDKQPKMCYTYTIKERKEMIP
jgi:hypothetical protein